MYSFKTLYGSLFSQWQISITEMARSQFSIVLINRSIVFNLKFQPDILIKSILPRKSVQHKFTAIHQIVEGILSFINTNNHQQHNRRTWHSRNLGHGSHLMVQCKQKKDIIFVIKIYKQNLDKLNNLLTNNFAQTKV